MIIDMIVLSNGPVTSMLLNCPTLRKCLYSWFVYIAILLLTQQLTSCKQSFV